MDLRIQSGRKELGRRIQTAIAQAGYSSLPDFAEKLGCSRTLIYQYISGDCLAQLDRLVGIAELTGRSLDWFIADDPNAAPGEVKVLEERAAELQTRCEQLEAAVAAERGARLNDANAARASLLEALQELCRAQRDAGDMSGLMRSAARVEDVARSLANNTAFMIGRLHTGHAALGLGQRELAEEALKMAADLAAIDQYDEVEIAARQELVRLLQASGRLDDAREQAVSLTCCERWWPRWAAVVSLAAIEEQRGDLAAAEQHLARAEEIIYGERAPEAYVRKAQVYVQSNRINISLARGEWQEAARLSETMQELAAEAELPDQVREAMLNRAIAALRLGDFGRARHLLDRLREWAQMAAEPRMAGLAAVFEAERLLRTGDPAGARKRATIAIEMGNRHVSGQLVAEAELVLGMASLADGLHDDAAHHLRRCRQRANRLHLRRLEVAAHLQEVCVMARCGDEACPAALTEVLTCAQQCGYADLVEDARRLQEDQGLAESDLTLSRSGEE